MSVLIVGSVALDSVETVSGKVQRALGGSATYAATAASFFVPTQLVGVVGDDFPEEYTDFLKSRNIDLEGLERKPGATFHWAGRYMPDFSSRETLLTELNVFADFQPILPDSYRESEYVFLANIAPELQLQVLAQVKSPRLVVADTMNLWINIARDALLELIPRLDILILNDEEARQLTEESNLIRAGRGLLSYGLQRVIINKGAHGSITLSNESYFVAPPYPVENVVDPTGAGDSFAGGFIGCLASTGDLSESGVRRAILSGTALASYNVEDFSLNRQRALTRDEVDTRLGELISFVSLA